MIVVVDTHQLQARSSPQKGIESKGKNIEMCKWKHPHQQENVVEPLGHLGVEVRGEHFGGGQHGMVGPVLGLRQP